MFTLKDTPNYKNYLTPLKSQSPERNTFAFRVHTNEPTLIRFEKLEDGRKALMLGGGPKLVENEFVPRTTVVIKTIARSSIGFIIITENDLPSNEATEVDAGG